METGDSSAGISDLQAAFEVLSSDAAPGRHDAALRFLEERGPDAEAYELLAALEARYPASPAEATSLLTARSRLRRALCAAWADDPLGEAPQRLGCPGAGPASP